MTGEINRVPSGLLSLLDMKARGQNPRILSAEVSGSLELLPLYLQQGRGMWAQTCSAGVAPGNVLTVAIPQTEMWWVHGISIQGGVTTAALGLVPTVLRTDQTGAASVFALSAGFVFANGDALRTGWQGPWLLMPGDNPGFTFFRTTAAQAAILQLDRTVIPI